MELYDVLTADMLIGRCRLYRDLSFGTARLDYTSPRSRLATRKR